MMRFIALKRIRCGRNYRELCRFLHYSAGLSQIRPSEYWNNKCILVTVLPPVHRRGLSTFVSKHAWMPHQDITAYLTQRLLEHKRTGKEVVVKHCPFCHATNGRADNLWKLYIEANGGAYMCHRCGSSGSWYDFKRKLSGFGEALGSIPSSLMLAPSLWSSSSSHQSFKQLDNIAAPKTTQDEPPLPAVIPDQRTVGSYPSSLMDHPANSDIREYLNSTRGLSDNVLCKYGVGCAEFHFAGEEVYEKARCVTFPWVMRQNDVTSETEWKRLGLSLSQKSTIVRIKARALRDKGKQKMYPAGGLWGLFGLHTVPPEANEIVLTEGEYDAMAVYQATGFPAVSLPNGCRNLPVAVLPLLERFEKIYLWMDADGPGQEGTAKFAKKLGERRCSIVRPLVGDPSPPKDANEALIQNKDLQAMLNAARPIPHDYVVDFASLREQVMHEIRNPSQFVGTPLSSFPRFTKIIKGLRRGELSVFTGPTGAGKTTLLSQISLDMASSGVNTLWGSFEVQNSRLVGKMIQQFAGSPLPTIVGAGMDAMNCLADRFQDLPLQYMTFHGGTDLDLVLDAMDYAVYVRDVEHVILDNLQFMIGSKRNSGRWDKFEVQDDALGQFRKFATERNIHISLVIHPRKGDENVKLGINSIFGSAKMTQEADLVTILQLDGKRKSLDVRKNRFDGDLGEVYLYFDHSSQRLRESQFDQQVELDENDNDASGDLGGTKPIPFS
eukprot:377397_1